MNAGKKFIAIISFIFIFTLLSGAGRKWLVNGSQFNSILFFGQLICPFLVILMGGYKVAAQNTFNPALIRSQKNINTILILYGVSLIVFVFNPKNETIYHGMLGFSLHFAFWLFMFTFIQYKHLVDLHKLIPLFLIFSIAEIALGIIQYNLPANHPLNTYNDMRSTGSVIALVGDRVRVTGSFTYLSGFTSFLIFYPFLLVYLIATRYMKFYLIVILVGLGLIGVFISGARTAFVMYFFILLFGLLGLKKISLTLKFLGASVMTILILVTFLLLTGKGQSIFDFVSVSGSNFKTRYEQNKEYEQNARVAGPIQKVFNFRGKYPLYGVGLGATYQGATQMFGTSYFVEEFGYYEEEAERIILEGGYLLLLVKIILCLLLVSYMSVSVLFSIPMIFLTLFYIPIVYNVYNIIFLGLGLILIELAFKRMEEETKILRPAPERKIHEDSDLTTVPTAQPSAAEGT